MRRGLAHAIRTVTGLVALACLGAAVRAEDDRGGPLADLAAGAIVVGIVAAIAWADHELEAPADATD